MTIPDDLISPEEQARLGDVLGVRDPGELNRALGLLATAAIAEYKHMLLGNGVPNRADEVKQFRLFCLLQYYFRTRIPTEAEVSSMFQLTETQSRSLLRNTRSRFRQQVEPQLYASMRSVVAAAQFRDDSYRVVIQSDNILEELNSLISRNAPGRDPITKLKNASRTYLVAPDSYEVLCDLLQVHPAAATAQP